MKANVESDWCAAFCVGDDGSHQTQRQTGSISTDYSLAVVPDFPEQRLAVTVTLPPRSIYQALL